ncbi:RICIN domain-containing protein [Streptomyces sp. PmtG]
MANRTGTLLGAAAVAFTSVLALGSATASAAQWPYPNPNTGYTIASDNNGLCIAARGKSDEAPVIVTTCAPKGTAWADQQWDFGYGSPRQPVNLHSRKCLTGRTGQNARIFQCGAYLDQKWYLDFDTIKNNGHFMIRNANSGACLVARGDSQRGAAS